MASKKKHLLVFAWEFPGVNSNGGSALARRIGQIAFGYSLKGWDVTVIHKDHIHEENYKEVIFPKQREGSGTLKRIAIKGEEINTFKGFAKLPIFRKIQTAIIAYRYGDRSYHWALNAFNYIQNKSFEKPDLIISFFTPRGPLLAGNLTSAYFNTPWIADLQDTFDEGYQGKIVKLTISWTKKILKTASKIVHVSPEWAQRDGNYLDLNFHHLRHAIPNLTIENNLKSPKENKTFTILYAGSLNPKFQDCTIFINALNKIIATTSNNILLKIAGSESVFHSFSNLLINKGNIQWLGWLSQKQLFEEIQNSSCLLVINWADFNRQVVPSKVFEYAAFHKPILFSGIDSGSIKILLDEWQHPQVVCDSEKKTVEAIELACQGDFSKMFLPDNCKYILLDEQMLVEKYISLFTNIKTR